MAMKKISLLFAALAFSGVAFAQNSIDNPMTRAVLEVYAKQLKEDPQDYETWLNRANEYYRHSEYMRALSDVDNALKYIPSKDTAQRISALMLRANIYIQTERKHLALEDLNSVISLDPDNYVALYQRANIQYSLGNYTEAKIDFQRLQRLNPRSPESFVGLARIANKESNLGVANEYLEQAVNTDPNNSELYVRRATVRRDMGNHLGAVEDLIVALATNSRNNRAMAMLVEYGDVNYPVVIAGLTEAIRQAPNVGMYPYLRAVIAQHHYHYKAALADYQAILDHNLYNYQGIWRSMAECRFAMGDFEKALADVDHALDMDHNAGEAALLRARILRAMGRYDEAKAQAASAVAIMKGNVDALNEMGLVYVSLKDYKQAADLFAETTLSSGDTPEAQRCYMLRAWMLGSYLNQPVAATGFYEKVADIAAENEGDVISAVYGAFGRLYAGHEEEAAALVESLLSANPANSHLQYLGACFYAQSDNTDKALECAERALEAGYANYYDWQYESDARVNVEPLRDDLRFINLLDRYKHLW